MNNTFENLKNFFKKIKEITFWKRIFSWNSIKSLSYEAFSEFELLIKYIQDLKEIESSAEVLKNTNEHLEKSNIKAEGQLQNLKVNNEKLLQENTILKEGEENRKKEYEKSITALNTLRNSIELDRQKIQTEREEEIKTKFAQQKSTWTKHEELVETAIKEICRKHTVEYVDKEKVPFKGKPDNTITICEEYVIFDAKSPANDDLTNFPSYILRQAEAVKKYIKEADIKKDIFLVIPSNTLETINLFTYNMGDYNVYIITIDSLEPIILSLKKIEEYEFVEQLNPEDRDNICRVIGKFIHTTKRRIVNDNFFNEKFISIIKKAQLDIPKEMLDKVFEFEISEKLNPPIEKRAKQISISSLEEDTGNIKLKIDQPKNKK